MAIPRAKQLTVPSANAIRALDRDLLNGDRMRLLSAATLQAIDPNDLLYWCVTRARYALPTVELIDWLRDRIADRRAIEVAAGMGDVGFYLGIPMSDSYMQLLPEMQLRYAAIGQSVTRPPKDVERLGALAAVEKYRPEVVIACWLTQAFQPGDEVPPKIGSSVYGPDERVLLERAEYIHVGNRAVHGDKRILSRPHSEVTAPWLVSRAFNQAENVIWTWPRIEEP